MTVTVVMVKKYQYYLCALFISYIFILALNIFYVPFPLQLTIESIDY